MEQGAARNKHFNKTKICRANNIRLFHIFETDWLNRKSQILNFIKTILGGNKINIAARKCSLSIGPQTKGIKGFIDDNHIQGSTTAIKSFTLYCNEKIVATMTAARHHRQGSDSRAVVLSRLCFLDGHNVQGGSSRLFKAMKQWAIENDYTNIISWSDNSWTDGNIYKVLGFELEDEFGPDYFYWSPKGKRYYSKQSQKKSETGCPPEITERDWCYSRGLYRLFDSGKKRWRFNLDQSSSSVGFISI